LSPLVPAGNPAGNNISAGNPTGNPAGNGVSAGNPAGNGQTTRRHSGGGDGGGDDVNSSDGDSGVLFNCLKVNIPAGIAYFTCGMCLFTFRLRGSARAL
jgi:hypothetical protein